MDIHAQSDTSRIRSMLTVLTKTSGYRTYTNLSLLDSTARYIHQTFSMYSRQVKYQEYAYHNRSYRNVICTFGPEDAPRIIVGAHYDVCGEQEGADDNASGIVGLLELARLLQNAPLKYRVELVAYTLEEPPFFRTEMMGSYIHAKSLSDAKVKVMGMISLEMIGYFSDVPKSQRYPIGLLSLFYGKKGNYITLIKKTSAGKFSRKFCRRFKSYKSIRTKKLSAPSFIPGIDFSDHMNYWKFGYSALMITDTAFYRNSNYHLEGDRMEVLDLYRMSKVIDTTLQTLLHLK